MAKIKVAINGFCRMGRSVFKVASGRTDIEVVAIRTDMSPQQCAYLLKHDSVYGTYTRAVEVKDNILQVGDSEIAIINQARTATLPWARYKVDVLIDVGHHTDAAELRRHITAGARRVVSLSHCNDFETIVMGVNDDKVTGKTNILCSGDAALSAIAPIVATLDQAYNVKAATVVVSGGRGLDPASLQTYRLSDGGTVVTRIAYSQALQSVAEDLPQQISGVALDSYNQGSVGVVTLSLWLGEPTSAEHINQTLAHAAREPLYSGIITVTDKSLVAEDFKGNSYSATIDAGLTSVAGECLAQVSAWYDSEWASANRLVELATDTGRFARNIR